MSGLEELVAKLENMLAESREFLNHMPGPEQDTRQGKSHEAQAQVRPANH